MTPPPDLCLRLRRDLTPDQALAVLDTLDALQQALWDAYEAEIVARILNEDDLDEEDPTVNVPVAPTIDDDIPF